MSTYLIASPPAGGLTDKADDVNSSFSLSAFACLCILLRRVKAVPPPLLPSGRLSSDASADMTGGGGDDVGHDGGDRGGSDATTAASASELELDVDAGSGTSLVGAVLLWVRSGVSISNLVFGARGAGSAGLDVGGVGEGRRGRGIRGRRNDGRPGMIPVS